MPTKKARAPSEWKHVTVSEFKVPNTSIIWRTQTTTAPDGKDFVGLRKFAVKASGEEVNTTSGLTIALGEVNTPRLLRKLSVMLSDLADKVEAEID